MKFLVSLVCTLLFSIANAVEMPHELKDKTITLVSHSVAGGWNDTLARTIAKKVEEQTKIQIVVVNRPGASGNIGARFVKDSLPNGLTLCHCDAQSLMFNAVTGLEGSLRPGELEGITLIRESPLALIVPFNSEINNINQLLETHKKRELTFATIGAQITYYGVKLASFAQSKKDLLIVPYKGDPENAIAVSQNNADFTFVGLNTAINFEQAKRAKIIAITSANRMPSLKDYPTIKESVDMVEFGWSGIFVPKNTPNHIKTYLNSIFANAVNSSEFKQFIADRGGIAVSTSPQRTDNYVLNQFTTTNLDYQKYKSILEKK